MVTVVDDVVTVDGGVVVLGSMQTIISMVTPFGG